MGFSVTLRCISLTREQSYAGIESCRNSKENPKEVSEAQELCSSAARHSYIILGVGSGGSFCPYQDGGVLSFLGGCCSLGSDLQTFPCEHLCPWLMLAPEVESRATALTLVHTVHSECVQRVLNALYAERENDTHLVHKVSN